MKQAFVEKLRLNKDNIVKLETVSAIVEEYQQQGYKMTLRQLYYQLVSRDIIANEQREYSKLSILLKAGRMAGIVDWDVIEDRIRAPYLPYWADNIPDAIDDILRQYRLNRQEGQPNYIELWAEKDALSGVLRPITSRYHINLMINRGYSSCSAMYDAYQRFESALNRGQSPTILYLGDHDPSGLDMVRDIKDRLGEFGIIDLEVEHVALTSEQVRKYNPPPNPAKWQDPRAQGSNGYIAKFGKTSWEVDALRPDVLNKLLKAKIEALIDAKKFNAQLEKEEADKDKLRQIAADAE